MKFDDENGLENWIQSQFILYEIKDEIHYEISKYIKSLSYKEVPVSNNKNVYHLVVNLGNRGGIVINNSEIQITKIMLSFFKVFSTVNDDSLDLIEGVSLVDSVRSIVKFFSNIHKKLGQITPLQVKILLIIKAKGNKKELENIISLLNTTYSENLTNKSLKAELELLKCVTLNDGTNKSLVCESNGLWSVIDI